MVPRPALSKQAARSLTSSSVSPQLKNTLHQKHATRNGMLSLKGILRAVGKCSMQARDQRLGNGVYIETENRICRHRTVRVRAPDSPVLRSTEDYAHCCGPSSIIYIPLVCALVL